MPIESTKPASPGSVSVNPKPTSPAEREQHVQDEGQHREQARHPVVDHHDEHDQDHARRSRPGCRRGSSPCRATGRSCAPRRSASGAGSAPARSTSARSWASCERLAPQLDLAALPQIWLLMIGGCALHPAVQDDGHVVVHVPAGLPLEHAAAAAREREARRSTGSSIWSRRAVALVSSSPVMIGSVFHDVEGAIGPRARAIRRRCPSAARCRAASAAAPRAARAGSRRSALAPRARGTRPGAGPERAATMSAPGRRSGSCLVPRPWPSPSWSCRRRTAATPRWPAPAPRACTPAWRSAGSIAGSASRNWFFMSVMRNSRNAVRMDDLLGARGVLLARQLDDQTVACRPSARRARSCRTRRSGCAPRARRAGSRRRDRAPARATGPPRAPDGCRRGGRDRG